MRTLRLLLAVLGSAFLTSQAVARDLTVTVKDQAGRPVADAVVTVHLLSGPTPPLHLAGPYRVSQKDIAFHPFVLVAPVGAVVEFPNNDKVRHHVYSYSAAKRFELKLYSGDESRSVQFDKPGIVPVGCNIHDRMLAFIDVVDTPWFAKTDASGQAVIADPPAGGVNLTVWRPFLKGRNNEATRPATLPAAASSSQAFTVEVDAPPVGKKVP